MESCPVLTIPAMSMGTRFWSVDGKKAKPSADIAGTRLPLTHDGGMRQ
jgi:hypothetical protein